MEWLSKLAMRLRALRGGDAVHREIAEEWQLHIDLRTLENIRRGMTPEAARRTAEQHFGNRGYIKDLSWEERGGGLAETIWHDLKFGVRQLRKSSGFTVVAVLSLALGIGANTAIFSYIDAWMIKPLPYPQPDRLVRFETQDKKHGWTSSGVTSAADFFDFQRQNSSFEQTVAWSSANFNLTGDGPPELVEGGRVTWNYFDTLGAKPILGRTFTAEDDHSGAPHLVILSQGLWQGRYAGDLKIIGRNIAIGREAYTVVGVMPGTFQFPLMGVANLWVPLAATDKQRADRSGIWLAAFGRLKPGVSLEQARAETTTFLTRLEREFPQTNTNLTWLVTSMTDEIRREEGAPEVMMCFVIVGLVLLIACANVANLMLARATGRKKEFAVRGALGATGRRLARQLLTESLLLFLLGAAAGLFFGLWGMRWIELQIPGHIRAHIVNYGHVDLNFTTLTFTLAIALLCGLVFGLAPALGSSRLDVNLTLKEASSQTSGSSHSGRLRRIFVAAETALAVVVLISATLLVKSFIISVRSGPGFNPSNVLTAQLALPSTKYTQDAQLRNFSEEALERIHSSPGVASVGVASHVPFGGFGQGIEFEVVGRPLQPGERQGAPFTAVSQDYFSTMQIGLVKGRLFDPTEAYGSSPSVIVSQTMARQLWHDEDPIGKKLRLSEQRTIGTIVGVVSDVKTYHLREPHGWHIYVPMAQFPSRTLAYAVRTTGDSTTMAAAIRDAIWSVDRDQPVSSAPMETLIATVDAGNRVVTKLMVFFGALALFLGVIGIYGVMAHLVSQRTHEIGIRTALGASPPQVLRMVIGQGMKLALIGIAVGVVSALGATRPLATMLYQVAPSDPLTFITVPILFAMVAAAACGVPARRAMKVDPLIALRYE